MSDDRERFLQQAQYCRDEAALRPNSKDTKAVWLKLADEYEKLAQAVNETDLHSSGHVQLQAMQQQHQHQREDG